MKNSTVLLSEDLHIFLYKNWIERNDLEEELPTKIWMLLEQNKANKNTLIRNDYLRRKIIYWKLGQNRQSITWYIMKRRWTYLCVKWGYDICMQTGEGTTETFSEFQEGIDQGSELDALIIET